MKKMIIKASKGKNGIIYHNVIREQAKQEEVLYVTIRGGLSWPNQDAPGYYLILGQIDEGITRFRGNEDKKKPLSFLAEFESHNLSEFCRKLAEDTALTLCQSLFTDKSELAKSEKGYEDFLFKFCMDHKIEKTPWIEAAPYVDSFQVGANLIKEWDAEGALSIPNGTIIHRQLIDGGLTGKDFPDPNVTIQFYAINALRHVVAAFSFHNFGPFRPIRRGRRRDGLVV